MFSKFLTLWSKETLLDKAFKRTCKMLVSDLEMFEAAKYTLRQTNSSKMSIDVYQRDKKINKYEREVRRNVITHLAVAGKRDIAAGLSLVSIVIDVERIGDYTKNIADLAREHPKRLLAGTHEDTLCWLEETITERFTALDQVLLESDRNLAREIMGSHTEINEKCDKITMKMVKYTGDDLPCQSAVALALYARYLKRISSHLTNIASSVVNPFPRIGYREKKKSTS